MNKKDRPMTEKIAKRRLNDGRTLHLWSDGVVTFAFGAAVPGIGKAREPWARDADLAAGWALFGECCVLDSGEIRPALVALRKAYRAHVNGRPGLGPHSTARDIRAVIYGAL